MAAFKHVLVLMMGLTAPQANPEEIEVVCKFCTGVIAGSITKETVWRSPFANKRLEGPDEGFGPQDGLDVDHVGSPTKEDLSLGMSGVKHRRVGQDIIGEKEIIEAKHVKCGVGSVPAFEKVAIRWCWHESHLCGI